MPITRKGLKEAALKEAADRKAASQQLLNELGNATGSSPDSTLSELSDLDSDSETEILEAQSSNVSAMPLPIAPNLPVISKGTPDTTSKSTLEAVNEGRWDELATYPGSHLELASGRVPPLTPTWCINRWHRCSLSSNVGGENIGAQPSRSIDDLGHGWVVNHLTPTMAPHPGFVPLEQSVVDQAFGPYTSIASQAGLFNDPQIQSFGYPYPPGPSLEFQPLLNSNTPPHQTWALATHGTSLPGINSPPQRWQADDEFALARGALDALDPLFQPTADQMHYFGPDLFPTDHSVEMGGYSAQQLEVTPPESMMDLLIDETLTNGK
ncbi:MAG: hypothetical protein Q9170_002413 [Blastenia crenularia]